MSSRCRSALIGVVAAIALATAAACQREARRFREQPPAAMPQQAVRESPLEPGPPTVPVVLENPYEDNAYATAQGKQLFSQFNCVGCHAHGGGAIGPALMDDQWIYGGEPQNIYETISEGRPNGMPAFGGKLSNQQIWQLVAYVRSLSGLLPKDVAPGRDDHMQVKSQEQQTKKARPVQSFTPPQAVRP